MSKDSDLARLAKDHGALEALVRCWQEHHGLAVDGHPGPATMATLRATTAADGSALGLMALVKAVGELGKGEVDGDNRGPIVALYQGVDEGAGGDLGSWCAGFVSWCIEQAAAEMGIPNPGVRSSWARTLFARCRRYGRSVDHPEAGDIVLFERGAPGGSSHIGIVEWVAGNSLRTIEGNVGKAPAKVARFRRDLDDDRIIGYARLS